MLSTKPMVDENAQRINVVKKRKQHNIFIVIKFALFQ